jgi:CubicO group peptidase (beta-lactamase class C family)
MRRTNAVFAVALLGGSAISAGACNPTLVATGFTSHVICSDTFISGLPPREVFDEVVATRPGLGIAKAVLSYKVDREKREVRASFLGASESRAVYRDGLGCLLLRGEGPVDTSVPPSGPVASPVLPAIGGPELVDPPPGALRDALNRAFQESDPEPRRTKAIVVVHDGKIVAERYAPGYSAVTPLRGWSLSKSVMSALVGILVRDGKLTVDAPAPVAAWTDPRDPRHAITVDELLRMTSGLALSETGSDSKGTDVNTRILFLERDAAGAAASAPLVTRPGERWAYATGSTEIVSRIVRDAAGGHAADFLQFAQRELFRPLGMDSVTFEVDATGTPYGGSFMFATPRDWARFGVLYANDGVAEGRRILPEGWVRYSSSRTLDSPYAAGFWLASKAWRARWNVPDDLILGTGILGQRLVIAPSERLVIVRMGASLGSDDAELGGLGRLIADVREALVRPAPR